MIVFLMKIKNQILINRNSFQLLQNKKKSQKCSKHPGIYSYTNPFRIKLHCLNFLMYMIYMREIQQHNSKIVSL